MTASGDQTIPAILTPAAGGQVDATVLNACGTGLCVRLGADAGIAIGNTAKIDFDGRSYEATVAWGVGDVVGLQIPNPFDSSVGFDAQLDPVIRSVKDPRDRRVYPRCTVLMSGWVRAGVVYADCVVRNISLGGAKVICRRDIDHSGPVVLHVPKFGDFDAIVTWRSGESFGLQFADPPDAIAGVIGEALPRTIPEGFAEAAG